MSSFSFGGEGYAGGMCVAGPPPLTPFLQLFMRKKFHCMCITPEAAMDTRMSDEDKMGSPEHLPCILLGLCPLPSSYLIGASNPPVLVVQHVRD